MFMSVGFSLIKWNFDINNWNLKFILFFDILELVLFEKTLQILFFDGLEFITRLFEIFELISTNIKKFHIIGTDTFPIDYELVVLFNQWTYLTIFFLIAITFLAN